MKILTPALRGFEKLVNLKELNLGSCMALAMDTEINKLVEMKNLERISQLVNLDEESMKGILEHCKRFESIPSTLFGHPYFGTMTKLNLSEWRMTALPEGFGKLTSLQILDLSYCRSLLSLPAGFVQRNIT